MTIPWLENCPHSGDAWCLSCVAELGKRLERAGSTTFALARLSGRFSELVSDLEDEPDYQRAIDELRKVGP